MDILFQTVPNGNTAVIFFQSPLGILLITLAAGSIGGFVSHVLQRKSQHRTWLLENRINAFSEFLKIFEQCRANATAYIRNPIDPRINGDGHILNVYELYEPTICYSKVIRLVLDKNVRDQFDEFVQKHIRTHCIAQPESRQAAINEMIWLREEIHKILEKQIDDKSI